MILMSISIDNINTLPFSIIYFMMDPSSSLSSTSSTLEYQLLLPLEPSNVTLNVSKLLSLKKEVMIAYLFSKRLLLPMTLMINTYASKSDLSFPHSHSQLISFLTFFIPSLLRMIPLRCCPSIQPRPHVPA